MATLSGVGPSCDEADSFHSYLFPEQSDRYSKQLASSSQSVGTYTMYSIQKLLDIGCRNRYASSFSDQNRAEQNRAEHQFTPYCVFRNSHQTYAVLSTQSR